MAKLKKIRWRSWLIRVAGSSALLMLLIWLVPVQELKGALSRIPPVWFAATLVGFTLAHMVAAAKWLSLMDWRISYPTALRAHFAGLAANLCLPSAAGGDAVRAGLAYSALRDGAKVTAAAATDRLIDLAALAALAAFGAVAAGADPARAILVFIILSGLGAAALYFAPIMVPMVWRKFPRLPLRGTAEAMAGALRDVARRPLRLFLVWVLSMSVQGTLIGLAYMLALKTGLTVSFAAWAFAWAMAKIIAMAPVSINGLGLREASLAALLTPFGAPSAQVIAAGLAWQLVLFLAGGLGGFVLLLTPDRTRTALGEPLASASGSSG